MSEERVPHVFRLLDGRHTWMCPSRRKGFVWVLNHQSIPTSWGDGTSIVIPMLLPIEDWIEKRAEIDLEHERHILTSGLGSWMSNWHRIEHWP